MRNKKTYGFGFLFDKLAVFSGILFLVVLVSFGMSACAQGKGGTNNPDSINTETISENDSVGINPKKVSILGDSYSTFEGYIPQGFISWYKSVPKEGRPTDVTKVEQTWWYMFIEKNGYQLEKNNSYSGSTICNTGYAKNDYSDRSFVSRVGQLGNPDLILVYGGTNDAWAGSPLGDFIYEGWTKDQLKKFRPAVSYLANELIKEYPKAQIVFMINGEEITDPQYISSIKEVCDHYGLQHIMIEDIDKMSVHPDQNGMKQIVDQLETGLKNGGVKS